ncbi:MAG: hypothetical protein H7321_08130, partial [Bacteroidia bacterium]|nr:hypothetical protein [Bacteroidia bacterium]
FLKITTALLFILISFSIKAQTEPVLPFHDTFKESETAINIAKIYYSVDSINITGNVKTRAQIILRELTFKTGDSISYTDNNFEQSRRQILNTNLFNEVVIYSKDGIVFIQVSERWYVWPIPVIHIADRNFNQWFLTRDYRRVIYGLQLKWYNLRGRNETMTLTLAGGYTKEAGISYKIPYINKSKTLGLSFAFLTSKNKEIWYKTDLDKVQFLRSNDNILIKRLGVEASLQYRRKIFLYHNLTAGYRHTNISDTVIKNSVNPGFLLDGTHQSEIFQAYSVVYDKRDIKGYALKGFYFKGEITNTVLSPGTQNYQYFMLKGYAAKYFKLAPRWYTGIGAGGRYTTVKSLPYNNIRALGYNADYLRGYEYYVIDGTSYGLAKSNVKFKLLEKKYYTKKLIKNYREVPAALFMTVFYDAGYVVKTGNTFNEINPGVNKMPGAFQYGYGTGLDVVLYYNYVVRIEYAINRYNDHFLYLHFIAPL